jgi:hypothetical protein
MRTGTACTWSWGLGEGLLLLLLLPLALPGSGVAGMPAPGSVDERPLAQSLVHILEGAAAAAAAAHHPRPIADAGALEMECELDLKQQQQQVGPAAVRPAARLGRGRRKGGILDPFTMEEVPAADAPSTATDSPWGPVMHGVTCHKVKAAAAAADQVEAAAGLAALIMETQGLALRVGGGPGVEKLDGPPFPR